MPHDVAAPFAADLGDRIDQFVEAFNVGDLDAVMTFFASRAVYRPGDGTEHRGKDAIRAAFEPQFAGHFGTMRFDEHDRFIDVGSRKAVIRWTCRHDLSGEHGKNVPTALGELYRQLLDGSEQAAWEGVDVFHFDTDGRIAGKFSYAEAKVPLFTPARPRLRAR